MPQESEKKSENVISVTERLSNLLKSLEKVHEERDVPLEDKRESNSESSSESSSDSSTPNTFLVTVVLRDTLEVFSEHHERMSSSKHLKPLFELSKHKKESKSVEEGVIEEEYDIHRVAVTKAVEVLQRIASVNKVHVGRELLEKYGHVIIDDSQNMDVYRDDGEYKGFFRKESLDDLLTKDSPEDFEDSSYLNTTSEIDYDVEWKTYMGAEISQKETLVNEWPKYELQKETKKKSVEKDIKYLKEREIYIVQEREKKKLIEVKNKNIIVKEKKIKNYQKRFMKTTLNRNMIKANLRDIQNKTKFEEIEIFENKKKLIKEIKNLQPLIYLNDSLISIKVSENEEIFVTEDSFYYFCLNILTSKLIIDFINLKTVPFSLIYSWRNQNIKKRVLKNNPNKNFNIVLLYENDNRGIKSILRRSNFKMAFLNNLQKRRLELH